MKAVDGDRGINNRITYSITQGSQGCFGIDSVTGVVHTLKRLDRESPHNSNGAYILEIMVCTLSDVHVLTDIKILSK